MTFSRYRGKALDQLGVVKARNPGLRSSLLDGSCGVIARTTKQGLQTSLQEGGGRISDSDQIRTISTCVVSG